MNALLLKLSCYFAVIFVVQVQAEDSPADIKTRLAILQEGIKAAQAKLQSGYGVVLRETFRVDQPNAQRAELTKKWIEKEKVMREKQVRGLDKANNDSDKWEQDMLEADIKGVVYARKRLITLWFAGNKWRWDTYYVFSAVNGKELTLGWLGQNMRRLIDADGHWEYDVRARVYAPSGGSSFGPDDEAVWYVEMKNPLKQFDAVPENQLSITKQKLGQWDCDVVTRLPDSGHERETSIWICPELDYLFLRWEMKNKGKIYAEGYYIPKKYGNVWYYEKMDEINYLPKEQNKCPFYNGEIALWDTTTIKQMTFNAPIEKSVFTPEGLGVKKGDEYTDFRAGENKPHKKILGME